MKHFSGVIAAEGPLLPAWIGVNDQQNQAIVVGGDPAGPLPARLLIDTGASHSCIASKYVDALALPKAGSQNAHNLFTAGAPRMFETFTAAIALLTTTSELFAIGMDAVVACDFADQEIDGLIGRDLLNDGSLIYDGVRRIFQLSLPGATP